MTISRRGFLAASAVAAGSAAFAKPAKSKLVMIAGSPSHGPGAHEFNAGVRLLAKCLDGFPGLETAVCLSGFPKDKTVFDGATAVLCYADGGAGHPLVRDGNLKFIGGLVAKGVSLVCGHYGVEVLKDMGGPEFKDWIGGYYEHQYSCNPMWSPEFKSFPDHPVTRGVKPFSVKDEWYFNMRFRDDMKGVTPLLSAAPSDAVRNGPYVYPQGPYKHIQEAKGRSEHMMWCVERPDGGRGVGFTGGHFHANWGNPDFRRAMLNALVWASKLEVPAGGVNSEVSAEDLTMNLDPKGKKK